MKWLAVGSAKPKAYPTFGIPVLSAKKCPYCLRAALSWIFWYLQPKVSKLIYLLNQVSCQVSCFVCRPWLAPSWLPLPLVTFHLEVECRFASNSVIIWIPPFAYWLHGLQIRPAFTLCLQLRGPFLAGFVAHTGDKHTDFSWTFLLLENVSIVLLNCILPAHWLKLKQPHGQMLRNIKGQWSSPSTLSTAHTIAELWASWFNDLLAWVLV